MRAQVIHSCFGGTGFVIASCPISAAKELIEGDRLLIGWSSVRVTALETHPVRCFKSTKLGHTCLQCPEHLSGYKLKEEGEIVSLSRLWTVSDTTNSFLYEIFSI